jgi:hypothetical protein
VWSFRTELRLVFGGKASMGVHVPRDRVVEFAALALMASLFPVVTNAGILF